MSRQSRTGRSADQPLDAVVRAFYEVSTTATEQLRRVLDVLGLSESGAGLLFLLDPAAPAPSMRQVAAALNCDPSNVTLIGDKLEQAGLVSRQVHPDDSRAKTFVLTDTGLALRRRLIDQVRDASPLAALTAAERTQLLTVLRKLGAR